MEIRNLMRRKIRRDKVIFSLTPRFNMFVMAATMSLFLMIFFLLKDAFLLRFFALGLFVGALYGIEWIRTIDRNWDFYKEFCSPAKKTPIRRRIMMEPKNLLKMWWSTAGSVILGLTLAYINI